VASVPTDRERARWFPAPRLAGRTALLQALVRRSGEQAAAAAEAGPSFFPSTKVGIRAQMLDTRSGQLVTDFLLEAGLASTHVLNAISPAFTSAFPFARHACDTNILR